MNNPTRSVALAYDLMERNRTRLYDCLQAFPHPAPAGYLRPVQLRHAAQMLKEKTHSVAEVAETAGFNTPACFRPRFQQHFKASLCPSDQEATDIQEGGGQAS